MRSRLLHSRDQQIGEPARGQSSHRRGGALNTEVPPALSQSEWALGVRFTEYLATLDQFRPMFEDSYAAFAPPPAIVERLESLQTRHHIAVLTGGYCPDCHDFVPVFARLAETTLNLELRIFPRAEHPVLAERFATNGKHYIPTAVVMDDCLREVGRFVERPQLLKDLIAVGENPRRLERRGIYQMAAAEEVANFLFTSR